MSSKVASLWTLAEGGLFRASELAPHGIPRSYLSRWEARGLIERVGRGLYRVTGREASEAASVVEVSRRVPRGVLGLLSALPIHGLGSEVPSAVWLLLERGSRAPTIDFVAVEIVWASGDAFSRGVEIRRIDGVPIPVTTPAKTVADCFRFRRHVGLEVALEALRGFVGKARRGSDPAYSISALREALGWCRVSSVVKPYLEALL